MVTALRQVSIITHCSLSQTPRPVKYEIYGTAFMYNLHQRVVCNRHLVKKPVNVKTLKIGIGYFISSFFNYLRHTCNRNRSSGQGLWQEQIFIFYPVFTEENLCGQRRYKFQDPVQIQKNSGPSNTAPSTMEDPSLFPPLNDDSTLLTVVEVVFVLLLIIFGLVGNFGVCAMVYTHRHLQTIPNYLIVNLSISDLLRIFFTLSVSAGVLIQRRWISGETFCHVNGCYTLIFLVASLMSVTIISVNRYFLIVRPNESATIFSQRRTRIMLFTLWFLAVAIAIPPNLGWGHYGFFVSRATCFIAVGSSYSYTSFLVIAFIAAPFSVLIWCYMKIYLALKKSKQRVVQINVRSLPVSMSAENNERLKKEVR